MGGGGKEEREDQSVYRGDGLRGESLRSFYYVIGLYFQISEIIFILSNIQFYL